jgi:hypothetical protein
VGTVDARITSVLASRCAGEKKFPSHPQERSEAVALTAVLRKFRAPAAVLTLSLFLGLFLIAASDAGAYPNPLPVKNAAYQVDGDPDLPAGIADGNRNQACTDVLITIRIIVRTVLSWEILGA